jgi:hypothetical protein
LVLDLRVAHERWASSTDATLNGHPHYPNVLDKPLIEAAADRIRKYRADYNQNPQYTISFMPTIVSTSGRLHSEFVRILFLQNHRETDRFFETSGVQLVEHNRGGFHYLRVVFSSLIKAKRGEHCWTAAFISPAGRGKTPKPSFKKLKKPKFSAGGKGLCRCGRA